MSKWADYGFPLGDITPVSLLLEGLELALAERYDCAETPIELDAIEAIEAKARYIDNLINGIGPVDDVRKGTYFATPDYARITDLRGLEVLASYLGEELVPNPGNELSPVTYEWCMQRYRMINTVYGISMLGRHRFRGISFSDDEPPHEGDGSGYPGTEVYFDGRADHGHSEHPQYWGGCPVGVYNAYSTPATVIVPFVAQAMSETYRYNSFGTSYEEGKSYVYSGESTGVRNELVSLPQGYLDCATMYDFLRGYSNDAECEFVGTSGIRTDRDGYYKISVFYDFRKSLEFYDDISQEG